MSDSILAVGLLFTVATTAVLAYQEGYRSGRTAEMYAELVRSTEANARRLERLGDEDAS